MAKIRKRKLSWKLLDSEQVVGYKLYWSKGNEVSYDSSFLELGKVNEVYLPDVLKHIPHYGEPIMLGITTVDKYGNESDITTLAEPYQLIVPPAPVELLLTTMDELIVVESDQQALNHFERLIEGNTQQDDQEESKREDNLSTGSGSMDGKVKYYDDVGYRKLD